MELLNELADGKMSVSKEIVLDTFEQHHRISKDWPKIKLPGF